MRRIIPLLAVLCASALLAGCNVLDKKNKAGLQVITSEIPSTVFINGQYLEKTPLIDRNLQPGEYTLRIQPDDPQLSSHETTITLRAGLLSVITWKPGSRIETSGGVIYEMEPLKNKNEAEVSFVSIPDGAIISLQGRDKEFAPVTISKVVPGAKEFEVTLPSYETQRHTLNVVEGYRMIVKVKLAKLEDKPEVTQEAITIDTPTGTSSAQTASPSARVKILSTNYFQNDQEVLRVRSEPGPAGTEIGTALVNQEYPYLNETQENWYKIDLNGQVGWVSGEFAQLVNQ